jgi:hypothetical protein
MPARISATSSIRAGPDAVDYTFEIGGANAPVDTFDLDPAEVEGHAACELGGRGWR